MVVVLDLSPPQASGLLAAVTAVGGRPRLADSIDSILSASRLLLSGGGAVAPALRRMRDAGFVGPLIHALTSGVPTLGIDLGMHVLFDVIYQDGQHTGLGVISGKVIEHYRDSQTAPAPEVHAAWTPVHWAAEVPHGLTGGETFYFDHTHVAVPLDPAATVARAEWNGVFPAVIRQAGVRGVQFDPARSGEPGLRVLAAFLAAS